MAYPFFYGALMETTYRISSEDANKIHEWLREEVYPAAVAYQKQTDPKDF